MVVFTCSACGDSQKRVQMERHLKWRCRGASVSCMDCGTDFLGDSYRQHVQCVSEKQKYGPAGSGADPVAVKQHSWMETVRAAVSDASSSGSHSAPLRSLLLAISQHSNVPRKRSKFVNFVQNSVPRTPLGLIEQAWTLIQTAVSVGRDNGVIGADEQGPTEPTQTTENSVEIKALSKRERKLARSGKSGAAQRENLPNPHQQNNVGDKQNNQPKTKKHKRKHLDSPVEDVAPQDENQPQESRDDQQETKCKRARISELSDSILAPNDNHLALQHSPAGDCSRFDWCEVILSVLGCYGDADDDSRCEMALKKLRRKVLAEYENRVQSGSKRGPVKTREQAQAKLDRKLQSMRQINVIGDRVRLVKT